ncbi:MAG: hypothetical protein ACI39E_03190, partial [Acutalibacteraceae bacterium]
SLPQSPAVTAPSSEGAKEFAAYQSLLCVRKGKRSFFDTLQQASDACCFFVCLFVSRAAVFGTIKMQDKTSCVYGGQAYRQPVFLLEKDRRREIWRHDWYLSISSKSKEFPNFCF